MYTPSEIDSILHQCYVAIGDIALEVTRLKNKGVRCEKLYHKGYCLRNYMHAYERGKTLTEKEQEALLKCIIEVSQIREYPASAPLLYRNAPTIGTGVPGPKGDTGDAGPAGPQGPKGDTGDAGPAGPQGPVGPTGAAGPAGVQGIQGIKGDTGDQGPAGNDGATGPAGVQGVAGAPGDRYATNSTTSVDIPTTHPTAVVIQVATGLAYTGGQQVIVYNNSSNYFIAEVSSYVSNTGVLNLNSISNTGTGTFASWTVNLNGAPGPQGQAYEVDEADINLTASWISGVEAGSHTKQDPYVASVFVDNRADKSSPAPLNGNMDGHSIQYNGTNWVDNGIWRGPQGIQGPAGPAGPAGAQGPAGPTGATGATGAIGPQGVKGDQGDAGPQGPQGVKGDTGDTGPAGPQGPVGNQGPQGVQGVQGPAGPQGIKGDTGDTGAQGIQGPAGPQEIVLVTHNSASGNLTIPFDDTHAFYHVDVTGSGTIDVNIPAKPAGNPSDSLHVTIQAGTSNSTISLKPASGLIWYNGQFFGTGSPPALEMGDSGIYNISLASGASNWHAVGVDNKASFGLDWFNRYVSNSTPPLTPAWPTTGAIVDTGIGTSKDLMFIISVSAYNNSIIELDVQLEGSANGSDYFFMRGWRYKPDIIGASTYAIPFTMMYSGNTSYQYFRVRVRRANNNAVIHRDTSLYVKEIGL